MENKIIRSFAWFNYVLISLLIINHMLRDLNWMPLTLLLIPAAGLIYSVRNIKEVNHETIALKNRKAAFNSGFFVSRHKLSALMLFKALHPRSNFFKLFL